MSDLNIDGLAYLYTERAKSGQAPQPRVARAYWRGRVDEFIAQNAVTTAEVREALALAEARTVGAVEVPGWREGGDGFMGLDCG